jgi:4-hydroxy 2-oxovalerate aldolase
LPGIGTISDLAHAKDCGASIVRVATHVTEADISAQHIQAAKSMGLMSVGFLMMVHMLDPDGIAEQAKKMESYGADYTSTLRIPQARCCPGRLPRGFRRFAPR